MEILIYVNMDLPWRKTLARKVKVTLSLREDVVRRARSKLAMEGRSLNDVVEEFLLTYDELHFLNKLCESLALESRFYTSSEITSNRSTRLKGRRSCAGDSG